MASSPGAARWTWPGWWVMDRADALRLRMVKRAVEFLGPAQAAELLVAAADMEVGFRKFGLEYVSGRGQ
jgi:hypothetical protein